MHGTGESKCVTYVRGPLCRSTRNSAKLSQVLAELVATPQQQQIEENDLSVYALLDDVDGNND